MAAKIGIMLGVTAESKLGKADCTMPCASAKVRPGPACNRPMRGPALESRPAFCEYSESGPAPGVRSMTSSNVWLALVFGCAFSALPAAHATTHDGSGQGDTHTAAARSGSSGHAGAIASSESTAPDSGTPGAQAPAEGTHLSAADGGSCADNASTSLPKGSSGCAGNGNGGNAGSASSTLGWQSLLPGSIQ